MLLLLKIIAGFMLGSVAMLVMGLFGAGLPIAAWVGGIFGLYTTVRL